MTSEKYDEENTIVNFYYHTHAVFVKITWGKLYQCHTRANHDRLRLIVQAAFQSGSNIKKILMHVWKNLFQQWLNYPWNILFQFKWDWITSFYLYSCLAKCLTYFSGGESLSLLLIETDLTVVCDTCVIGMVNST